MIKALKDNRGWIFWAIILGVISGLFSCSWDVGVLMFTATILVWYSAETRGLRIKALEANRISVHPGLTLRYIRAGENQGGDWKLILSNVGKGVALNPGLEVIGHSSILFDLNGVPAICPGDNIDVSWKFNEVKNNQNVLMGFSKEPIKVKITCSSVMDPTGEFSTEVEIKSPPHSIITKLNWL